jgi:hypothetical protein
VLLLDFKIQPILLDAQRRQLERLVGPPLLGVGQ